MRNLAVALLAALCTASHAGAQPAMPGAAPDWWARAPVSRSKYYAVKTDLPKAEAVALSEHMDATFEGYMAMFSKLPVRVQRPATLDLYLFATRRDYLITLATRFKNDGTGSWGKCISRRNRIALVGWQGDYSAEEMQRLLQHEGFHQVAKVLFSGLPLWANEGLAELFERGVLVGGKLTLGEFPRRDRARLIAAAESGGIIPFDRFLAISSAQWKDRVRQGNAQLVYLQAWSMIHFFVFTENGKYERNFLNFLVQLNRNVNWKVAFVNSFGKPDFRGMEKKWLAYLRNTPPSDYRETVRRLDFLAAGSARLAGQDVRPATFNELKAALRKIDFEHASELFGKKRLMSAADDGVFEVPYATEENQRRFVLVDSRNRIPADYPTAGNPLPLNIVATGLEPQMFVAGWTRQGRRQKYAVVAKRPVEITKANENAGANGAAAFRTWTSADGTYSTEARLITFLDGTASLKKQNGKTIKVPYEKLSPADRRFLDHWNKPKE